MKQLIGNRVTRILLLFSIILLPLLSRVQARAAVTPQDDIRLLDPIPTPLPDPEDALAGGKPPLTQGGPTEAPVLVLPPSNNTYSQNSVAVFPTITVWYESDLKFGQLGNPQQWANIHGNVSGVAKNNLDLSYTLNGGPSNSLAVGADVRRLSRNGDFNIELDVASLQQGTNTVVIRAENTATSEVTNKNVTFNYQTGNTWPSSFVANWGTASSIYDVANVVDGEWTIQGDGTLRPLDVATGTTPVLDYDRLVAIGDMSWTDYQVTVPLTIHGIDSASGFGFPSFGPGVGLILRWNGHYQVAGEQPRTGWEKLGALGWYRWSDVSTAGLQMIGYSFGNYPGGGNVLYQNSNVQLAYDTEYIMKMNVDTTAGGAIYRFRVWRSDLPEPDEWHMVGTLDNVDDAGHPAGGSMVLVAHHVDVSFGNVTTQPLSAVRQNLTIAKTGSGDVDIDPPGQSDYEFGSDVTLTAVPDPGHRFVEWQGDITGTDNPATLTMDNDKAVTAVFEALPTLTVSTIGNGTVDVDPPGQSYFDFGTVVTVTAVPEFGYLFTGWSGSLTGNTNPDTITMDGDKSVTATFVEITSPLSDNFNQCTPPSMWTEIDPKGDGTIAYNGTQVSLSVPAVSEHDLWTGVNDVVRIMQPAENNDFELEVKFESGVDTTKQMQGIIVEQDANRFIRFDFYSDPAPNIFAASFAGGNPTIKLDAPTVSPNGSATWYLRVTRLGNNWTLAYSFDDTTWNTVGNFNYTVNVTSVGVFVGNAGNNPPHTAIVDYFDHTGAPSADDPLSDQLTRNITGQGDFTISPASYGCGDNLTLTAVPDSGWSFTEWGGAAAGTDNQASVTFDVGMTVAATFKEQFALTVNATGGGTVDVTPEKSVYLDGDQVTLQAVAVEGWEFENWSGGYSGTGETAVITMTGNLTITANFRRSDSQLFLPLVIK